MGPEPQPPAYSATGATLRTNLEGVKVTAVEDAIVRVETAQPNATLLSVLAFPEAAVVSKKWMQGGPNVKVQANGTGPFRLKSYEPSVRAELEKNPSYIVKGQPYLQSVDFRIIKSDDARVNALRTGSDPEGSGSGRENRLSTSRSAPRPASRCLAAECSSEAAGRKSKRASTLTINS